MNFARAFLLVTLALVSLLTLKAKATDLETSLSISNTATLKQLEASGFSLADLISGASDRGVLDNKELSQKTAFNVVLENLRKELDAYKKQDSNAGVGLKYDHRLFDIDYLENPRARFVLVGVINRMDTGYRYQNRCGETRFVYRLAYNVIDHDLPVSSRLPMTINLVFKAGGKKASANCTDLAKAWLNVTSMSTADDLVKSGPLAKNFFDRENIKALELNLQMVRLAASARPDFGGHAEYLLKVFDWNGNAFEEAPLENQIDRARLVANPALLSEMKHWLLDSKNAKAIDAGTFLIPTKFLARKGVSISPAGMNRSANRIFDELFSSEELAKFDLSGLENIKSPAAFLHRLNDSSCVGCHQTRAIGGFHFTGKDPLGKYPGNSVFLPGSAHFMGDLVRRRAVVEEIAEGKEVVDFSRGFSGRPQARRSKQLNGTGLVNGWGAHCSVSQDPSFKAWTCADGLVCKQLFGKKDGRGMGICLAEQQQVGGPCESGVVKTTSFGVDRYVETSDKAKMMIPNAMCSPQSQQPGTKTGGFLNGNIRTLSCENLPAEASCGPLPASRPGFNACLGHKNFGQCLREYSIGVGLRGCDQTNPCRDDYICSESLEKGRGSCVPPYFLFQFRVDGHPKTS